MAFVAISGSLLERVQNKIKGMRDAELKTLGEAPITTISPTCMLAKKTVWKDYVHLYDVMPKEWINTHTSIDIKFKVPGFEEVAKPWFTSRLKSTSDEFRFPPKSSWYDNYEVSASEPEIALLVEHAKRSKEIETRWHEVYEKVIGFLSACKSANEAVKLWPQVKIYLDKEDIERIEKKVVRSGGADSNAAQALAGIDTASVESAAVIARLSGAQV
jgi:hypothetical protein